ncbi:unnamed protein product, partial [Musa textilis]
SNFEFSPHHWQDQEAFPCDKDSIRFQGDLHAADAQSSSSDYFCPHSYAISYFFFAQHKYTKLARVSLPFLGSDSRSIIVDRCSRCKRICICLRKRISFHHRTRGQASELYHIY